MKKILVIAFFCLALNLRAQTLHEQYIAAYSDLAVEEMLRSGVPASITLAQGLLESGAGQSRLAVEGNNHFGIKCHQGWTGPSIRHDDDAKDECFRAYSSPDQSFRDHSDFLRYRDRYKFLFDLDRDDYKGWAYGLRKAGYATDPGYATKLIKYIEDYRLYRFDSLSTEQAEAMPEPPHRIEEPLSAEKGASDGPMQAPEEFQFSLSRQLYSLNGVPFVYAVEGQSYASIARDYHLFLRELLKYNDLAAATELTPGTVVYLGAKKNRASEGLELYIVEEDGENFYKICQRFAVKEKAIRKLNGFGDGEVLLREGDRIKLR